jgi:hypothetical protein
MANCALRKGQNIVNLRDHTADPEYKKRYKMREDMMRMYFSMMKLDRMMNGTWIEYTL